MQRLALLFVLLVGGFSPTWGQDVPLKIVASFSILADVVQNVAGDKVEVISLIPLGADPHAFQPTPQEVAQLAEADVVFINGANFEEGLLEVIENAGENINVAIVSSCVAHEESSEIKALCEVHHAELHPDEAIHAVECGHQDEEAHEHEGCDPHVWTNPQNVMLWTLFIRDTLSTLDPANAETYAANATAYLKQLRSLDEEIESVLSAIPAEKRVLVTNHETLGYFAAAYGFEIGGVVIAGGSSLAEPSAGDIAALIDTINEQGITAIFAENTVNTNLAEQVSDETGAEFYTLYSDSLSAAGEPASTYLDYMRANVQTIASALGE